MLKPNPLDIGRVPDGLELAKVMRLLCPVPGSEYSTFMSVHLDPPKGVAVHKHGQHTVLFYPASCDPLIVTPQAGMMIYLPPDTLHEVPPVKSQRLSIAMLVELCPTQPV